jgi:hypothetical protein
MTMLAEDYDYVIGGDPDRDTVDLAVLDTSTGGVGAHLASSADGAGYAAMLEWACQHAPGRRVWALEGTGSFAAGLSEALAQAGEDVVEVGGVKRVRGAKSDVLTELSQAVEGGCVPGGVRLARFAVRDGRWRTAAGFGGAGGAGSGCVGGHRRSVSAVSAG